MLFRKNIYKKEKGRKVGHEMFYLSIPLNIAWTNLRIRRLLISVDTCFYTFTTIAIVSPKKRIFCADKRKSRICGSQMNMVYLKSDCYGLLIKENELDCAQAKNIFDLYWPKPESNCLIANWIPSSYRNTVQLNHYSIPANDFKHAHLK